MEKFNRLSSPLRTLIDRTIENAMDMVYDMTDEKDFELMNLVEFRNSVYVNALDVMSMEMDPDNGDAIVPFHLTECIKERVNNNVNFKAVFE